MGPGATVAFSSGVLWVVSSHMVASLILTQKNRMVFAMFKPNFSGRTWATGAAVLLTALSVAGAAGAVSWQSTQSASRTNTVGTTVNVLGSTSTLMCFLTRVGVVETDTGSELAECEIVSDSGQWVLYATLGTSSDADVYCTVRCYYM